MTRKTLLKRLSIGVLLAGAAILLWPLPRHVRHPEEQLAVSILDRAGKPLYEVRAETSGSYRFMELDEMPPALTDAIVAIEDRNFRGHPGVSPTAVVRAVWQNVSAGRVVSGGSTLTQQLVRNVLKPERRTFPYKVKEALYALKLDAIRSKDEILRDYLNTVYFGHQAYGVDAAANTYFGKSPAELSLAESALLAGLVQSPSALDPYGNMEGARRRQARVLAAMRETGVITPEEEEEAAEEAITLTRGRVSIRAPHFSFWLRQMRPEAFAESGEIRTTIDLSLQTEVERIVERRLADLADKNVTSAAVVVLDARTGDLLAMVGSADYFDEDIDGSVNVAVSPRQPGSAVKPFTYALALMQGDTAATTVADVETQFFTQDGNPYIPRNYDYGYHGLVRYREALANSYNIAAVKALERVGVSVLVQFLRSAGISTLDKDPAHYGLALTLGDAEVSLLELATAYALFPRGGETLNVRLLAADPVRPGRRILDPRVAWLISDILSDDAARLPEFGDDSPLGIDRPAAAKTGTTRNSRDNWTMGYTPEIVAGVWVGNADNSPMRGTSGVTGAGPIFHDVMLAASRGRPKSAFERPAGISRVTVCRLSGKLPTPDCPHTVDEWFIDGTEPREKDDLFRRVKLDRRNGLLATDGCDPAQVIERGFAVFPPALTTWALQNGWPQPPRESSPLCSGTAHAGDSWLEIIKPQQSDSFRLDPLIPDDHEKVIFQAQAGTAVKSVEWYVNGQRVGAGTAPTFRYDWKPGIGSFVIEARGAGQTDRRTIEVTK